MLNKEELDKLEEKLFQNKLSKDDINNLLSILQLTITLRALLQKRTFALKYWLRQVFGLKTEKKKQRSSTSNSSDSGENNRHGRNSRDDYPGAEKVNVKHPDYCEDDDCPECNKGKLSEGDPGVDYDWQGSAPLTLTIYLLQRFICNYCKATFTAPSPVVETAKTVDDSEDDKKVTKCNRNAFANAVVACFRYMYGVATYRLAKIQAYMGMALPEGTQYKMIAQVYEAVLPVYEELMNESAKAELILADDTWIKILEWLHCKDPPEEEKKEEKKTTKAQTTAIVSKLAGGQNIVLYLTDEKQAGHHVDSILSRRELDSGLVIYKCDGLAGNKVSDTAPVILTYCLDHARRKFVELEKTFPKESKHVIDALKLVYKADAEAKKAKMTDQERLLYHQTHSKEVMENLGKWMLELRDSGKVEENGELANAINYSLKRWSGLTEFLHTPGVPLSNSECEQMIKFIITHRKNSMFYKTTNGAHVGDVIQSLIVTCQRNSVNPFKYLAWIQENKSKIRENANDYLPWKYSA